MIYSKIPTSQFQRNNFRFMAKPIWNVINRLIGFVQISIWNFNYVNNSIKPINNCSLSSIAFTKRFSCKTNSWSQLKWLVFCCDNILNASSDINTRCMDSIQWICITIPRHHLFLENSSFALVESFTHSCLCLFLFSF